MRVIELGREELRIGRQHGREENWNGRGELLIQPQKGQGKIRTPCAPISSENPFLAVPGGLPAFRTAPRAGLRVPIACSAALTSVSDRKRHRPSLGSKCSVPSTDLAPRKHDRWSTHHYSLPRRATLPLPSSRPQPSSGRPWRRSHRSHSLLPAEWTSDSARRLMF